MGLEFKYPILLLLFIPASIVVYLFYKQARAFSKKEKNWITIIRSLVFSLLIISLTVPQIIMGTDVRTVIFLADTSASMRGTDGNILDWIDESVKSKREIDQYSIISMGKNSALEQMLTNNDDIILEFAEQVDPFDTNIERGLQFAQSVIPPQENGRIVLFSDGNETAGQIMDAARLLKQRGIVLDYVPVEGHKGSDMAVTEFNVPSSIYEGETVPITLEITSNVSKTAVVQIKLNDNQLIREEVTVNEGTNLYTFTHVADDTGLYVYKAEIAAEEDTFSENNSMAAIANVKGTPKILVVQKDGRDKELEALRASGLIIEQIQPSLLPTSLASYLQYDSILFNNVSATDVGETKMNLIEQAVKEFGTGFVMTGGEESYGLGGYFKTPIEDLLPVDMEVKGKEELPSLGLIIVLDRSGSMQGEKLSLAKEAAARSVDLLRDKDTLGFIAFDDRPWEIIEAGPLVDKETAIKEIRSVPAGGGTEIFSALKMAYDRLMPLDLQRKHIILLTDGQSATNSDYFGLIDEGKEENITLSTVALGQDADKNLLTALAEQGTGRFYDVVDDSTIPSILARETAMITRTYIVDEPFYPVLNSLGDWQAILGGGVPQMNAYIAVTPKDTAQVILSSHKEDPVLAEWQYGLGRTIAYTSDLSGKWAGDWLMWDTWPQFLNYLVTRTLPSYNSEPYAINVSTSDSQAVIQLTASDYVIGPVDVSVVSDTGEVMEANVKMRAPGQFEVNMEQKPGVYFLSILQRTEDNTERLYKTGFTVPYSEELIMKGNNFSLLEEAAKITGGSELTEEKMAFAPLPYGSVSKQPISHWLILLTFLLFFIEIAVRRFGLFPIGRYLKKWKALRSKEKQVDTMDVQRLQKRVKKSNKPAAKNTKKVKQPKESTKPKKVPKVKSKNTVKNRQESLEKLLDAKKKREKT